MDTRRNFLKSVSSLAVGASLSTAEPRGGAKAAPFEGQSQTERISLTGLWQFRFDPDKIGQASGWHKPGQTSDGWQEVTVPHTWQIVQDSAEYSGIAWYRRKFELPPDSSNRTIRTEFEAVFHSATVWINGIEAGKHLRKGYTAFYFDITRFVHPAADNVLVVMVSSDFDSRMLPRGHSSDWTHDGGIYRPVSLLITPKVNIERVDVDAAPDVASGIANLDVSVVIRNTSEDDFKGELAVNAIDESSGLTVLPESKTLPVSIMAGKSVTETVPTCKIANPKLWHFDAPNLYCLTAVLTGGEISHEVTTIFGIRSIEVKDRSFWLNGERVRLMGVERMAGSNPNYGMAEPTS